MNPDLMNLPGADLIAKGIEDLGQSKLTMHALLICIAKPRLEAAGLSTPPHAPLTDDAELLLYALIKKEGHLDPYSFYNSLLKRLISFEQALEQYTER